MTNTEFKEIRMEMRLSQEQFGKAIGLSKSSVSNIEKGFRKVTSKHEKLIEAAFGKPQENFDLSKIPTNFLLLEIERRCLR